MGRPILYKTSKEFLMRFGLSDLQELPSLKEFESLAREALGSDMGVAPGTDEAALAAPTADTLENLSAAPFPASAHSGVPLDPSNPLTTDLAENDQLVPTEFAAPGASVQGAGAPGDGAPGSSGSPCESPGPSDDEFLREREVESTGEGMPSGELDEEPPKADSASAGE
jgi:segregation and condensation protein B